MVKPCILDQIKNVKEAAVKYPEYEHSLSLVLSLLIILKPLDAQPTKGLKVVWRELIPRCIQRINEGRPAVTALKASMFDEQAVMKVYQQATTVMMGYQPNNNNLKVFYDALLRKEIDVTDVVVAIVNEDVEWFINCGEQYNVDPSTLFLISSLPIQPLLEEVARRIDSQILNQWWQTTCPICARKPFIAWMMNGKKMLTCSFCGAQYLSDLFICVNCGNTDPYLLGFMSFKNLSGVQIDFCKKCGNYVKVLNYNECHDKIARGLEDYLTVDADTYASEAGLNRI